MRVFVTGGTGFVGAAVIRDLLDAGHDVAALVRSSSAVLPDRVARIRGGLADREVIRSAAAAADAAIHCAFDHRFGALDLASFLLVKATRIAGLARVGPAARLDLGAIAALVAGLGASSSPVKALISTSPIALLPPGRAGDERDRGSIRSFGCTRVASERNVLRAHARGVRSAAVRLPPSVHGPGDHGFVPSLLQIARATGISAYRGSGENRWSAVHVDDAAALYRRTLEGLATGTVAPGSIVHAIADEGVTLHELATAIASRLGLGRAERRGSRHFGSFGMFVGIDAPASSTITRQLTGWQPSRPSLLEDVRGPAYDPATPTAKPVFATRRSAPRSP